MVLQQISDSKEEPKREIIQVVNELPTQPIRFMEGKDENGKPITIKFKTVLEVLTEIANQVD